MEVKVVAKKIGSQVIVDTIAQGDLILNPQAAQSLSEDERLESIQALVSALERRILELPAHVLSAAQKENLQQAARSLAAADNAEPEQSRARIESFLSTLRRCFGETADVVTKGVNLAQVIASAL